MIRALLLFLVLPFSAAAQYYYVPVTQSTGTSVNASSVSCVFSRNVTSGNILIVSMNWYNTTNTPTVSDTLGNTWTQKYINTVPTQPVALYTATSSSSGADTITVAITGGGYINLACSEHPPIFSLTVDASASSAFSGSPGTVTTSSITTTKKSDFIYSWIGGFQNGGRFVNQTNSTLLYYSSGNDCGAAQYRFSGATGSYSDSFTNNNTQGTSAIVAFQPLGLTIDSATALPDAALSNSYSYTVPANGGIASYTWSVSAGTLPTGLSLNSSTGAITGTPTVSNNYSFTLQVTDGTSTTTKAVTIKVCTGFNTPAFVQFKAFTSGTAVMTSSPTAGNLLVVFGGYNLQRGEHQYCTDTRNTVFTPLVEYGWYQSAFAGNHIFAGLVPSTGADTVTCTDGQYVAEFSNLQLAGNDNLSQLLASSASPISSTLTTLVPNEAIVSWGETYTGAGQLTVTGAFTGIASAGALSSDNPSYDLATTVTSYTSSYTMTANTDGHWYISMAGFRPAANGTVTPPPSGANRGRIL